MQKRFALIGAAGYIAPRHMKAIKDTGNILVSALDVFDSVGIIDSYFPDASFFTEPERFDRHLDKLRRIKGQEVEYVSICSPNYLHDAHIRMALRNEANAICEKPLVLNPWNIDALEEIEKETGKNIYTILQLRLHPAVIGLKQKIDNSPKDKIHDVDLTYITSRGKWYFYSWKGDVKKSGGLSANIGIHFFDMLTWIFGDVEDISLNQKEDSIVSGNIKFKKANVRWLLSVDENQLPADCKKEGKRTFRNIVVDGEPVEFSQGFTDLHTVSYQNILDGKGFGLNDARKSIEIVSTIKNM
ncbi:MAG: Gfo/Idh/MocA family oxidoreductase [Lentimicrobiaceae bacterium]|nr:Gfo/Idh/MocA family oxidoreductase [Lentimicrobiaceae bacterium]